MASPTPEYTLVLVFGTGANAPSFQFLVQGYIRQNHPFGNHPCANSRILVHKCASSYSVSCVTKLRTNPSTDMRQTSSRQEPKIRPLPQPLMIFHLILGGGELGFLSKETLFSLLRESRFWKLEWERFCLDQVLLMRVCYWRRACRQESSVRSSWVWEWGSKSDPHAWLRHSVQTKNSVFDCLALASTPHLHSVLLVERRKVHNVCVTT